MDPLSNEGEDKIPTVIVVEPCTLGWAMGGIFSFEVGKVMNLQAKLDDTLELVDSPDIPKQIELYIAKSIKEDLNKKNKT